MTRDQLGACIALSQAGKLRVEVALAIDIELMPIPGLQLFTNAAQTELELVQPDGTVIDLLAVLAAAEDTVRNWHNCSPKHIPHFVGDFGRLTKLAEALNGRRVP